MPRPTWVARATNAKRETLRSVFLSWRYSTGRRLVLKLHLQPGQQRYGPTQSKALVCQWEDGAMERYYRGA